MALERAIAFLFAGVCIALMLRPVMAADASGDGIAIPCALPSDAVTAVPAPFDKYMELTCTHAGQALKPLDGFRWVFVTQNNIMMWLTSNNTQKQDFAPSTHFTKLAAGTLSAEQLAAFHAELHKFTDAPVVFQSTVIKMDEETSGGAVKQIYLLLPPAGTGTHVLGIECIDDCIPMEEKPWAFVVMSAAELAPQSQP
jgi:hypothetical protein